jgi:peptidyl-prolyl cis-trans isomerase SurA
MDSAGKVSPRLKLMNVSNMAVPALLMGALSLGIFAVAQSKAPAPSQSPMGGTPIAEIVVRVNDQIISRADYDRALDQLVNDGHQQGASEAEIEARKKDMLRDLIDQQLLLSKGKELNITGETELIHRLDDIRKQNHMESMEDLEKAAKEQGVSYEDFKANIRNGIVTQEVVRQEVGRRIQLNSGDLQNFYDLHKAEFAQPETVRLSEILVSTAIPGLSDDQRNKAAGTMAETSALTAAKTKADEIEARLKTGESFEQIARSLSDGPTAKQGGQLGDFKRGMLAKVIEDKAFALKAGQFTDPIRTKQGYLILQVTQHTAGGTPTLKEVEPQVEEAVYMQKMQPALRQFLTQLREEAYVDIKPGFVDSGASAAQTKPIYSAYTPPAPKKKKQVERTRFREKAGTTKPLLVADTTVKKSASGASSARYSGKSKLVDPSTMKPGKREKIRYGQAPRETLPSAVSSQKEDAGALPVTTDNANQPANPLEPTVVKKPKSRYSVHAHDPKVQKSSDVFVQPTASAAEVAAQQTQSGPLGLGGNQAVDKKKKKKAAAEVGEKTRISDQKKPIVPADSTTPAPAPSQPKQ